MASGAEETTGYGMPDGIALSGIPVERLRPYEPYLEEFEMSEAQKLELLAALYAIMKSFVEIGFGLDSVQRVLPALFENASSEGGAALSLSDTHNATAQLPAASKSAGEDGFE